jgi:probable F420-dependent oxidoreductase
MKIANVVADARQKLGPVGVFLPGPILSSPVPAEIQRRAARGLEHAGVNAAWNNEVVYDKDAFVQLGLMLGSTNRMAFGTAIANIWARSPQTAAVAAAGLAEAYPGRFVLGLGVGYPVQANSVGRPWGSPLANVREYFERMDAPHPMRQVPDVAYPRILAARGPKMLALAAEIADGANPNGVPPEYTFRARQVLGPNKLLVVGVSTVLEHDLSQARATAREDTQMMAQSGLIAPALTGLGYSAEELSAGSDRLAQALIAYGGPAEIVAKVQEHLDAGADHVIIMLRGSDYSVGLDQLGVLAPELVELSRTFRPT